MQIDEATIERLAQRIHENYLAASAPGGRRWHELTEDLREANRAQARDIPVKLAAIGATVEPGPESVPFVFSQPELDRLAEAEHRRWMDQRLQAGWRYSLVRNDATKQHPMLLSWDLLPEVERVKDRDAVRNIPAVLAGVGLRIVRR
jgi:hypothetical protein